MQNKMNETSGAKIRGNFLKANRPTSPLAGYLIPPMSMVCVCVCVYIYMYIVLSNYRQEREHLFKMTAIG